MLAVPFLDSGAFFFAIEYIFQDSAVFTLRVASLTNTARWRYRGYEIDMIWEIHARQGNSIGILANIA